MQFTAHTDPISFRDTVQNRLLQTEAECCAQISLIHRLATKGITNSPNDLPQPLMWTIHDGQSIDVVALQTIQDRMWVTQGSIPAMCLLARELAARKWDGKSIIGKTPSITALARHYSALSRRPAKISLKLRVFDLINVQWPSPVSGSMRLCEPADRQLLADYLAGHEIDIGESLAGSISRQDFLAAADRAIDTKSIFFWVDQQPVAMAAWAGPTPHGIRVNRVYTPPQYR